jgi:hypothetical protein
MPILIWIATIACLLEMAGALPASPEKHDPGPSDRQAEA